MIGALLSLLPIRNEEGIDCDSRSKRACGRAPNAFRNGAHGAREMRVMVFAAQLRTAFELARKAECGLMIHEKQAARRRSRKTRLSGAADSREGENMGTDTPAAAKAIANSEPIAGGLLSEHQRLATSGARTALPFHIGGELFLAVPQLSEDVPGQAPHMNAGNSDIDAIIY